MYTNHDSPERILSQEESYALVMGFVPADGYTPAMYDQVKLLSDGTITKIAAVTDRPFGYVSSSYTRTAGTKVRIVTPFTAIIRVDRRRRNCL
jgi:hypothetical protein